MSVQNMAALLVKACLTQSTPKSLKFHKFVNNYYIRISITFRDRSRLQLRCYHNTPVFYKHHKFTAMKKKLKIWKEMELNLNDKPKKEIKLISVWKNMTVEELAASADKSVDEILDALFFLDKKNSYNGRSIFADFHILNETVKKLGAKMNIVTQPNDNIDNDDKGCDVVKSPPPNPADLVKRRPIITIMGHVDHGKTTLLDSLRNSSVVDSEFGGITQHIGAFNVTLKSGEKITFLDTPGHAAFSAMRARGANVTDIIILVVAADDGVMDQTVQSINMAKNSNVPIIVAVNKIDKPNINIKRTHLMLAEQGIHVEDLGGDVQSVNISALNGTNLDQLMDAVLTQAEIMDLKGDPKGKVEGVVIEATADVYRGKLATVLIQRGTLKKGDFLVSGLAWAKVRSIMDHLGSPITQAGLSDTVQIIGWRDLPLAGDEILQVENERKSNLVMKYRHAKLGEMKSIEQKRVADEKHKEHLIEYEKIVQKKRILKYSKNKREGPREKEKVDDTFPKVSLIIKGDVLGSVEAILNILETYDNEKRCKMSIVHYGVGQITETDLDLAKTFDAIVYCFNTTIPKNLSQFIRSENIKVHHHNVIYRLIDDIKMEINKKLPPIPAEEEIGEGIILQEFDINEKRKKIKVVGCRCIKGIFKKSATFKVIRDNDVIFNSKTSSLKHLKEEVETIKTNIECGIKMDGSQIDFKPGDKIICYTTVEKFDEIDWDPGF